MDIDQKVHLLSKEYLVLLNKYSYKNSKKLYFVFEFWLKLFFRAHVLKLNIPKNCLNILALEINSKKSYPISAKNNVKINIFIKKLIVMFPLKIGRLQGGDRQSSWIYYIIDIITAQKLIHLKMSINIPFRSDFLKNIEYYLDSKMYSKIKTSLPDNLFFNSIDGNNLPSRYIGSPFSLISQINNLKILFSSRVVDLIGIQHGGAYGEINNWLTEDFELKIADKYFHWGLGQNNIIPNRFRLVNRKHEEIDKIFILGTPDIGEIDLWGTGFTKAIHQAVINKRKKLINVFSKKYEVKYIKHPRQNYLVNKDVESICMKELNKNDYRSSLFILDFPLHTFFYQAIYQNIPFLMFYNKEWKNCLTPAYNKLLDLLYSINSMYYWNEEDLFLAQIDRILKSRKNNMQINEIIKTYLARNAN